MALRIRLEPEEKIEDGVRWIDLVWGKFRLERGHSEVDTEWDLLYEGEYVCTVDDIGKAQAEIRAFLRNE